MDHTFLTPNFAKFLGRISKKPDINLAEASSYSRWEISVIPCPQHTSASCAVS
jgi:hypothetical protein